VNIFKEFDADIDDSDEGERGPATTSPKSDGDTITEQPKGESRKSRTPSPKGPNGEEPSRPAVIAMPPPPGYGSTETTST
ncbi:hypothetical protein GCK32_021658, partial [Trichostrongylus colubriformis]